jgi:uroporphyrinogen-III synthase
VNDFGYRNLRIYQLARTLAAIAHTITLSRPGLSPKPSSALRKTSKLLLSEIVRTYRKRAGGEGATYSSVPAAHIASDIVSLIQSPQLFPHGTEKDQAYLLNSYSNLLESFHRDESSWNVSSADHENDRSGFTTLIPESDALEGKVILITRSSSQRHSLVEGISVLGGLPVVIPMIEFADPESWDPVDRAIMNLPGYEGVVFTSQNAVERFLLRINFINSAARSVLASRQVSAVGDKTRAALEKAGIPVTLMPDRYSATDLVASLRQGPIRGKRYLFPKGDLARGEIAEALRESDAVVDEVVVYRTTRPENQELEALRHGFRNNEIDAVTFFSPSSVHNFSESIRADLVGKTVVACIGPSTTEEAGAAGFQIVINAREATVESLVGALVAHFETRPTLQPAKGSDDE